MILNVCLWHWNEFTLKNLAIDLKHKTTDLNVSTAKHRGHGDTRAIKVYA